MEKKLTKNQQPERKARILKALEMHNNGATLPESAKAFNLLPGTLRDYASCNGITLNTKRINSPIHYKKP